MRGIVIGCVAFAIVGIIAGGILIAADKKEEKISADKLPNVQKRA